LANAPSLPHAPASRPASSFRCAPPSFASRLRSIPCGSPSSSTSPISSATVGPSTAIPDGPLAPEMKLWSIPVPSRLARPIVPAVLLVQ